MAKWDWLTKPAYRPAFLLRVGIKAVFIFVTLNLIFAALNPLPLIGKLTLYNTLLPGRARLPYGENSAESYNLSLDSLDAMFASHEIAGGKAADEFRVLLIGDSATWGFLLPAEDTLAGQINRSAYTTADGREVRAYNVGYPTMSLTKDLLLLDYAMRYQPDLVIWLFTLESFWRAGQTDEETVPLVAHNPVAANRLIDRYSLALDLPPENTDFLDQTIVRQRRPLADWLRLQMYGVMWWATGIDQYYPPQYTLRQSDFEEDLTWKDLDAPQPLTDDELVFDVLAAGVGRVGETPILLVNEPMFISSGENSDLRYNAFYPRWAYDAYHSQLNALAEDEGWHYLDLWDAIDPAEFTDSPVHMTPDGTLALSRLLRDFMAARE